MSNQSTFSDFPICDMSGEEAKTNLADEHLHKNEGWLREQYHENGLTQAEIAELADVAHNTISKWMRKNEIGRRSIAESRTDGNLELLRNEEWLRERYCEQEKTTQEIAEEAGVDSATTVGNYMQKHGIDRRSRSEFKTEGNLEPLEDQEWCREQYCEQEKSLLQIAEELGVSGSTVGSRLKRYGIELRSRKEIAESKTDGDIELLRDEEWLCEQYRKQEKPANEIADEIDVDDSTVRYWMEKYGIESREMSESLTNGDIEPLKDEEWLRDQYCEREKTIQEIANELNLSNSSVRTWMEKHEIEPRGMSEARTDGDIELLKNKEWLREQYCEREKTIQEVAEEVGVHRTTVMTWMDNHGIDRPGVSEVRTDGDVELLKDKEWLREQYCEQERSSDEIAEEVGVAAVTVRGWMEKHGIERQSLSESHTDGNLEPLKNEEWLRSQYCEEKRTTYGIAEELGLSRSTVGKWLGVHDIETRSPVMHPDHLSHRVIGEMELNIANHLHDSGINYEYESLEIEYGKNRTYIPDFITENYVIECKGRDWGEAYDKGFTAEQKAEAAMRQLDDREYVVVGIQLPCDIHVPQDETETINQLF